MIGRDCMINAREEGSADAGDAEAVLAGGRPVPGDEERHALGDGDRVVGEPLVVAPAERDVDGSLDAVLHSSSSSTAKSSRCRESMMSSSVSSWPATSRSRLAT